MRIDGVFEAVLGAALVLAGATGFTDRLDFPWPAMRPVLVIFGLILLPLLPILWVASLAPERRLLLTLAAGNGAGAVVFVLWVLVLHTSFSTAGALFALAVAGILAVLAILQTRCALTI